MADEKQQKIEQYEEFINEKLKSDLKYVNISIGAELMNDRKLYEQRDKVLDEAAEYHRLGAMLSSIQVLVTVRCPLSILYPLRPWLKV